MTGFTKTFGHNKTTSRSCTACTFLIHGVKTRKAIPHTCGKSYKEIIKFIDKIKHDKNT